MTCLCISSSFFLLLLNEPEKHKTQELQTDKNEDVSVIEGIKQTWKLFISKRMLLLSPLIVQSAFGMSIHASVFVKLFDISMKTDDEGWDQSKRD